MAKMILFAMFIGAALAAPSHHHAHLAAPLVHAAPVVASAPVLAHAQTVTAVHHPAQINTHLAPTAIAVQTPTLSGYSFTSEVRHDAPALIAAPAPIVAAAPVVHAAPVVAAAPVVHAAAPLVAPAAPVFSKSYAVETGRLVAGHAVAAAPLLHAAPVVAHAAPVVAAHAPVLAAHAPLLSAWKKA